MGCLTYLEKLSDYIDDLLPSLERQQVEDHFSACPSCYSCYQDLVMICQASRNLPEHEPSPRVWENILAQVAPNQRGAITQTRSSWLARWFSFKSSILGGWTWQPALAAALIFISLLAIWSYRSTTSLTEPSIATDHSEGWAAPPGSLEIQPTNRLIVHKPLIEVQIVQQRIDELQQRIQTTQTRWSPEVKAIYQHHLKTLDHCLANCQNKSATSHEDLAIQAVYQSTLRAKLEMLKQFSDL